MILDVPLVSLEKKQNPSKFGPVAGQVVTHEQYGAVLQKGSKLLAPVEHGDEDAHRERHGRQAPEEVVQPQLREDPGPEVEE